MKNKRIASIVLAMTLVLSTFSTVFAADFDIIEVDGTGRYGFAKWTIDSKLFPKITISPKKYFIEYGEENYELDKVMEKMNDGKSFEDAIAELEPVEEEDEGELKVVSVSTINNQGVVVVFAAAPEEDLDDVTIEVLDNKGNVVEVEPITVAAGETEATFKFVKAIEGDMEGVWTIGGVKYDFDLKANLEAFINADNQIKLNKALTDLGIENVKVENMPTYYAKKGEFLDKLEGDLTVEAIQAWINEVNEKAAAVKAVKEAIGNDILLLAALEEHFDRVNPEWFGKYKSELTPIIGDEIGFDDIQGAINDVNNKEVLINDTANYAEVDRAELLKAKALIEEYATPTEKGELSEEAKKSLKAIDIQLAIVDVREASTPTRLKNALIKLDELLDKDAKFMAEKGEKGKEGYYAGYVDANAKLYFDYKSDTDPKSFKEITKASEVKTIIEAVNDAVNKAAEAVNKLIESTTVEVQNKPHPEATNGACYLLGYTVNFNLGKEEEEGKTFTFADTKSVVAEFYKGKDLIGTLELKDPNSEKVKDKNSIYGTLDVFGDYNSYSWKQEWNGKVTDIPTKVVVKVEYIEKGLAIKEIEIKDLDNFDTAPFFVEAVNRAQTAEEMSRALINLEAKMDKTDFTNLPKADKLIVAQRVLEIRNEQEGIKGIPNTAGKFFGEEDKLDASVIFGDNGVANKVIAARDTILDNVNGVADNADTNEVKISDIIEALETTMGEGDDAKPFFPEFAKLSPADKADVAEAVLNKLEELKADEKEFKTVAEIKAAAGL